MLKGSTVCMQGQRVLRVHPGSRHVRRTIARSMTVAKEQSTSFDLSVAVALAAAAFEAYLEPTGAEGLQDRAVNGTEVTYTDR